MGGPTGKQVDGTTWFLPAWEHQWLSNSKWTLRNPSNQMILSSYSDWALNKLTLKEPKHLTQYCYVAKIVFASVISLGERKCCECGQGEAVTLSLGNQNRLKNWTFHETRFGSQDLKWASFFLFKWIHEVNSSEQSNRLESWDLTSVTSDLKSSSLPAFTQAIQRQTMQASHTNKDHT